MAKKLSEVEKYAIKAMFAEGKSIEDIANELGRSIPTVRNHTKGLEITTRDSEQSEESAIKVSEQMLSETKKRLMDVGLKDDEASDLLNRTIKKLKREPASSEELYNCAIKSISTKDLMVRRSNGGRKGVAIMTHGASQKIDEFKKNTGYSRSATGNVFKIDDGKPLNG